MGSDCGSSGGVAAAADSTEGLKRQLEEAQKQLRDKDDEIKFLNVKLFENSSVSQSTSPPASRRLAIPIDIDLSRKVLLKGRNISRSQTYFSAISMADVIFDYLKLRFFSLT